MEDVAFVRCLKKRARVAIAPVAVSTSARRLPENGVMITTLQNQVCLFAYLLGVSPERIARWRGRRNVADRQSDLPVSSSDSLAQACGPRDR